MTAHLRPRDVLNRNGEGTNAPELSVVVPALNERPNLSRLVEEVEDAVLGRSISAELIIVDDGSTDDSIGLLADLQQDRPWLRVLRRESTQGQSAALKAGIDVARGRYVAQLDADLQNDPADLPGMLEPLRRNEADMVQGRRQPRQDNVIRRVSSWVGRAVRRVLLGDRIHDTGCSTRIMRRELARRLPLQYRGIHRFQPLYAQLLGARVVEQHVKHRPRIAGRTHYGMLNRGLPGLIDCLAVRWMMSRYRDCAADSTVMDDRPGEEASASDQPTSRSAASSSTTWRRRSRDRQGAE